MQNNYEKLCEEWRKKAITWDYQERYQALGLPGYNVNNLPITYYGIPYEINREDARIHMVNDPKRKIDHSILLAIYHLFYFSSKDPVLSNQFIPFREVKGAAPFDPAFQKQILIPFAKAFDKKKEKLIAAGEKLGFQRLKQSDVGFVANAFACMPIQFLFWDGDEEFPAQATILFDKNITEYTHEETVVTIASDGIAHLIQAAELLEFTLE